MTSNNRTILLTGGSGTLGSSIANLLIEASGQRLILPLRNTANSPLAPRSNVELVDCDLSRPAASQDLVARYSPDVVIHCAASGLRARREEWFDLVRFNVETTLRLFRAACEKRRCKFIHISSGLVYKVQGRPLTEEDAIGTDHPYGASKAAADLLLRATAAEFGSPLTILRPFSFTGVGDAPHRLFPMLLAAAAAGKVFSMSNGMQVRDYSAVADIAAGVVAAIDYEQEDLIDVINLGSGAALPLRLLVEQVCEELDIDVNVSYGARTPPPHEPAHLVADISKARRVLGWVPQTRISDAVAAMYFRGRDQHVA